METATRPTPLVTVSPDVMNGTPVFAGTNVPIQTLIDHLEIGDSIDGFLEACPSVTRRQVIGFLEKARDLVAAAEIDSTDGAPIGRAASPDNTAARGEVAKPYVNWESRPLPDPRTAPLSELVKGLVEIVGAEGPVQCYRAYTLYARSIGLQKIREETKLRFNRAMIRAIETEVIVVADEANRNDLIDKIARLPGSPEIVLRARGDRKIEEIPPLEIAACMRQVTLRMSNRLTMKGPSGLFQIRCWTSTELREVMTDHTKAVLQTALELAQDASRWE